MTKNQESYGAPRQGEAMTTQERTIWGIHAGKTGDADTLFLKKKFVAIGWVKCGDLGKLPPDREAYKELVAKTYPDPNGTISSTSVASRVNTSTTPTSNQGIPTCAPSSRASWDGPQKRTSLLAAMETA